MKKKNCKVVLYDKNKVEGIIDYEKTVNKKGREAICDFLANKNIEISDRNVDIIYKRFKEIIERFSNKTKLKCFEVSAKDGTNIDLIFKEITNLVFENKTEEEIKKEYMLISQSSSILSCDTFKSSNEKKKCC